MGFIEDDYLRYVMHVQVTVDQEAAPDYSQATYNAADDQGTGFDSVNQGLAAAFPGPAQPVEPKSGNVALGQKPDESTRPSNAPSGGALGSKMTPGSKGQGPRPGGQIPLNGEDIVINPKIGRNDPCWCNSGRKFKLCHGAS